MPEHTSPNVAVAERFAAALDRRDDDAAAELLAEAAELVYPGETVHGRDAWRRARAEQPKSADLDEAVEDAVFTESGETVEMTARLVQRWTETGEIASEMSVRIRFKVTDGLISRLEFVLEG